MCAKRHILKTNWSRGEVRDDIISLTSKNDGSRIMENVLCLIGGGITRRGGFKFLQNLGTTATGLKLFSLDIGNKNFICIFKNTQFTIYSVKSNGDIDNKEGEFTSPYTDAEVQGVQWVKHKYDIYFAHPSRTPHILKYDGSSFSFNALTIKSYPQYQFDGKTNTNAWGGSHGFPRTVTVYENRLWFAGTKDINNGVWASKVGDFSEFTSGTNDDDPIAIYIDIGDSLITDLYSGRHIQLFTTKSEHICPVRGVTYKNVSFPKQSSYGSKIDLRPVNLTGRTLFCQNNSSILRNFVYSDAEQSYVSDTMSAYSDTLQNPVDMDFFRSTNNKISNLLFCINSNGTLAVLNLFSVISDNGSLMERKSWTRWTTNGSFRQCTVLNNRLYVLVRRTYQGNNHIFLELYDPDSYTDSHYTFSNINSINSGLDSLEGQQVTVVADKIVYPNLIVNAGGVGQFITALRKEVEIGYAFAFKVQSLPVALPIRRVRILSFQFILKETEDLYVTYEDEQYDVIKNQFKFTLGKVEDPYNGQIKVGVLGYTETCQFILSQDRPLPVTILAVESEIVINY